MKIIQKTLLFAGLLAAGAQAETSPPIAIALAELDGKLLPAYLFQYCQHTGQTMAPKKYACEIISFMPRT